MRLLFLSAFGLVLGSAGRTLAQNTPAETATEQAAPFVRNIRVDRPGQTITAQVLKPGQVQLEAGTQRSSAGLNSSAAQLRIGFLSSIELRASQGYRHGTATDGDSLKGWAPLLVGAKLMLSPNFDSPTQVALLAETTVPRTGSGGLYDGSFGPGGRLLVTQQIGQRFGLEANAGFRQRGLTVAAIEQGQFLGTLALNGPLGNHAGFFVEAYGIGRRELRLGTTAALYWRPLAGLRLDVNAGRVLRGQLPATTVGAGLAVRVGK